MFRPVDSKRISVNLVCRLGAVSCLFRIVKICGKREGRRRDILENRYGRRSIAVASQVPVAEWHRRLDEGIELRTPAPSLLPQLAGRGQNPVGGRVTASEPVDHAADRVRTVCERRP